MKKLIFIFFACLIFGCSGTENPDQNFNDQEFGEIADIQGNKYLTIKIGDQIWMAENLRTSVFANGDPIPELKTNSEWGRPTNSPEVIKPGWSNYNNNPSNDTFNGKFYNWYAISDSRNCCPTGWKIPTKSEFEKLIQFLGSGNEALRKIKKDGIVWPQSDLSNNKSKFSAFPSGYRNNGGSFYDLGISTSWWTSDLYPSTPQFQDSPLIYWGVMIRSGAESPNWGGTSKEFGLSVRCIKN
jgi:uncharacterized protein (TIGR02145 family)